MTLLAIIFKSYTLIFLVIGAVALLTFALGLYFILSVFRDKEEVQHLNKRPMRVQKIRHPEPVVEQETLNDVSAISGDDPLATQLDLAKAYIESGKSQFARVILSTVLKNGNQLHQEEAKRLLSSI